MQDSPTLSRWLTMARDDEIVVDATDINHEASSNLWCFSPDDEESLGISAEALADFIGQVMATRQEQLSGNAPMLFYCWHEAQTRQLRFSLVSAAHGRLPFGCAVDPAAKLASIAADIVEKDWLNAEWGQPRPDQAAPDGLCEEPALSLAVFVAHLP
ncbi:hypothetical protein [Comamonas testosteroni]|uniref:hypothetical protein n=1 Tax=Comamonas testosteroni TaxID=285 RepID=UPI001E35EC4C|nr:hypothetical protein [Comamonas testosteroni]